MAENIFLRRLADRHLKGDPIIWGVVILLSLLSILVVYSATSSLAWRKMDGNTEYYLIKHSILVMGALLLMVITSKINYHNLAKYTRLALFFSCILLVVAFFFGGEKNAASRWLTIPIINHSFQPSDLAKLALITHLAAILAKNQSRIEDIKESVGPIFGFVFVICGVIALSNFSTAAILLATCLLLMVIGRVPVRYVGYLIIMGILAGSIAYAVGQRGGTLINRIEDFLDADKIPDQTQFSYIAISNGGLLGQGPGNSHQKDFLPHSDSDFIYAVVVEEYGLIGAFVTVCLFLTLLYRGMVTAAKSENAFGSLLSAGLSFSLALQALLNMAVATGMMPVTGQPLPLVSMGGTNLLFTGISFGIILSVSRGSTWQSHTPAAPRAGGKLSTTGSVLGQRLKSA